MKKILKSLAALALVAFAASCSKEQVAESAAEGEEALVSFTVATPALQTKAIADGTTVDKVSCNVYDAEGALIANSEISKTIAMTGGKATFSVRLVTGQTYSFVFWAYKDGAPYTLDAAAKKVTVSYEGATANDESRDAFYAYVAPLQVKGSLNQTVTLYRPFAQVNFGVNKDDITAAENAGIEVGQSSVKLTGLATELNLVDGTVNGSEDAEFALANLPAEDLTVANKAYGYVAMNYVLVGKAAKALSDVTLTVAKADGTTVNTLSVPNVPLQGNYRTNILGSLFTSAANFNLVVDPAFAEPDNGWAGEISEPSVDADGNYLITTAAELAWIAEKVNADAATEHFGGKTFILQNDINLYNYEWTPIGKDNAHDFRGTFDGNGKTIYNLNVSSTVMNGANAGLFGTVSYTCGPQASNADREGVKNLTINGATVKSTHYAGAIVAYCQYSKIVNCHVLNATVTSSTEWALEDGKWSWNNGDKVGSVVGYINGVILSDCSAEDVTVTGYRDLGGIVGYARNYEGYTCTISGCSIDNVTINVDKTHNYKGYDTDSKYDANSIVGEATSEVTVGSDNTGEATINYPIITL